MNASTFATPDLSDPGSTAAARLCSRCVMDTTDPDITFDERGVCNHCRTAERRLGSEPFSLAPEEKERRLAALVEEIRVAGRRRRYDCIIGVSGGVDSTYAAHVVRKLGLRPLAVHLDNGWDSKLAVTNIERVLKKLDIDLYTYVIDWEEFRDLQLSFLKASTPDSEIPTDHAIVSILYRVAIDQRVRHILAGENVATESILPAAWSHGHKDWRYIRAVHRRFGGARLVTFPHRSLLQDLVNRRLRRIRWINILDWIDYRKDEAMRILERELSWEYYGGKHHESIYTRFYQAHILPAKFGFDKRKAHLSSMIVSGQLTRAAALEELTKPLYTPAELHEDREYVVSKLGITEAEYGRILAEPPKRFAEYPSYERTWWYALARRVYRFLRPREPV